MEISADFKPLTIVRKMQFEQYRAHVAGVAGARRLGIEERERGAMKQQGAHFTALLTTLLTLAVAVGQNDPGVLRARIPFSFVVAGRTLPPGRYVLSTLGEETVRVASSHNQSAFVMTLRVDARVPAASGKLVFHRYQDMYFLAQVWRAGSSHGKQVFKSPVEEDLERKGARLEIAVLRTEK